MEQSKKKVRNYISTDNKPLDFYTPNLSSKSADYSWKIALICEDYEKILSDYVRKVY